MNGATFSLPPEYHYVRVYADQGGNATYQVSLQSAVINSANPAVATWADFQRSAFVQIGADGNPLKDAAGNVLPGPFLQTTTSVRQEKILFSNAINRSYSDTDLNRPALRLFLTNVAIELGANQGSSDTLAVMIGNTLAHEIGHDLGAIHDRDRIEQEYRAGDIMGFTSTTTQQFFDTLAPAVDFALGLPVRTQQTAAIWNYYKNWMPYTSYARANATVVGDSLDAAAGPPVLDVFSDLPDPAGTSAPDPLTAADLGSTVVDGAGGQSSTVQVFLANGGDQDLHISNLSLANGNAGYSIEGVSALPLVLPALDLTNPNLNQSVREITIRFDPTKAGPATDTLVITSDSFGGQVLDIPLTGVGVSPLGMIAVQTPNKNLGGVKLGTPAKTLSDFTTIQNTGLAPLTISAIQVSDPSQFAVIGLPGNFGSGNPLVLAPGQSYNLGVSFLPGNIGLQRGDIQIFSNDPNTAVFDLHVVGTGLAATGSALHYAQDYVAVENLDNPSAPIIREMTDAKGNWSVFLPPNTDIHYAIFDSISGLIAHGYTRTAASGQNTMLQEPIFQASTAPDTDGDGLPDDVEFAIGTSPAKVDTNGDGIDDFTQVLGNHTNPLAAGGYPDGVIARLNLPGTAEEVAVAAAPGNPNQVYAYIATDLDQGLVIADVSQAAKPLIVGQLELPEYLSHVAVDPTLQIAAVTSENSRSLFLINVSDPQQPILLRTIALQGIDASAPVVVADGRAYVVDQNVIEAFDLQTGTLLQSLDFDALDNAPFSGATFISAIARDGALLYVTWSDTAASAGVNLNFSVIDLSSGAMAVRSTVALPPTTDDFDPNQAQGANLFVGGGIAYIPVSGYFFGGYATVDVRNPDHPALLATPQILPPNEEPSWNLVASGSGLALAMGIVSDGTPEDGVRNPVLDVLDSSDPKTTNAFLARYAMPSFPQNAVIAAGYGFVADSAGGLVVVNFHSPDTQGQPPTVSISTDSNQVVEGSTFAVHTSASDDVQVQDVQLLVDGQVVQNGVSFPYDLQAIAPALTGATGTVTVQVRATDTAGNVGLSNVLTLNVIPDATVPQIVSMNVHDGDSELRTFRQIQVAFSKPMAPAAITAGNFQVLDANGQAVPVQVTLTGANEIADVSFAELTPGAYSLVIHAAAVTDPLGRPLGAADLVTHFTITPYTIKFTGLVSNDFSDHSNFDLNRLPTAADDVLIDTAQPFVNIPASMGPVHVADLTSNVPLKIDTPMTVDGDVQVTGRVDTGAPLAIGGNLSVAGDVQLGDIENANFTFPTAADLTVDGTLAVEGLEPDDFTVHDATIIKADFETSFSEFRCVST